MKQNRGFRILLFTLMFFFIGSVLCRGSDFRSLKGLKAVRLNFEFNCMIKPGGCLVPGVDQVALKSYIEKTIRKAGLFSEKSKSQIKVKIGFVNKNTKEYFISGRIELIESARLLRNSKIVVDGSISWKVHSGLFGPHHAAMALAKQVFINCFDSFENDHLKANPKRK